MLFIQLILIGIPTLSLIWWVWADRRLRRAGLWVRAALGLSMTLLLGGFVWVLVGRGPLIEATIPSGLYALVLLWGLIFLPFVAMPSLGIWMVRTFLRRVASDGQANRRDPSRFWTRRRWLTSALTTLPVLGTFGTAAYSLPRLTRFRIREITVNVADLPDALDGMRIAHVTDTHVGKFTRGKALGEIAEATNKLDADLVLFTGDLIDNTVRDLPLATEMILKMHARSGVFLIEGNHDLFDGAKAFEDGVREAGIQLLRNESATVLVRGQRVQLLGIVWSHDEGKIVADVEKVASLREKGTFPILMAHHPHAFDPAAKLGLPLTLAGHTHGGQLMLTPEFGAGSLMFRYWSGLYRKAGQALVVSNGTGNWFPLRVNAPAEIIHITLRRA